MAAAACTSKHPDRGIQPGSGRRRSGRLRDVGEEPEGGDGHRDHGTDPCHLSVPAEILRRWYDDWFAEGIKSAL